MVEKLADKVVKLTASLGDEITFSDDLQAQHENFRKMASCKIEEVRQFFRFKKVWEGKRDLYLTAQGIGKSFSVLGKDSPMLKAFTIWIGKLQSH